MKHLFKVLAVFIIYSTCFIVSLLTTIVSFLVINLNPEMSLSNGMPFSTIGLIKIGLTVAAIFAITFIPLIYPQVLKKVVPKIAQIIADCMKTNRNGNYMGYVTIKDRTHSAKEHAMLFNKNFESQEQATKYANLVHHLVSGFYFGKRTEIHANCYRRV